jgi:hypothetical protein
LDYLVGHSFASMLTIVYDTLQVDSVDVILEDYASG